jgi:hypothetical protein
MMIPGWEKASGTKKDVKGLSYGRTINLRKDYSALKEENIWDAWMKKMILSLAEYPPHRF